MTLTMYKVKMNKVVSLLSSFHTHSSVRIPESEKKKPDVVESYNRTKCGVDCFDSMVQMYSTRYASRRWPLYVFFNMHDIATINSWVLYNETTLKNISRRKYTLTLVEELISVAISKEKEKRKILIHCKSQATSLSCCVL